MSGSNFPKLFIFDFDGVLVDSELLIHEILVDEMARFGTRFNVNAFMNRFSGLTLPDIVRIIRTENKITLPDDFLNSIEEVILTKLPLLLQSTSGIKEALQVLPQSKCVASNAPKKRLIRLLETVSLSSFFKEAVFSAENVTRPKPHPDLFLFAAEKMGITPRECLVIEDSVVGIKAAKAAGILAFGYTGAHHSPQPHKENLLEAGACLVFNDMRDLPKISKIFP